MVSQICRNCEHFHQHYVIDDQRYMAVPCGHCASPKLKNRKPTQAACAYFSQRSAPPPHPDRNEVMHFLTKQMLEYILELPLPPEEVTPNP